MVLSEGVILDAGAPSGGHSSVVPLTYQAGGYGFTLDGRFGLVCGYQTNPQTARGRPTTAPCRPWT
jgi:hypothetical protein